MLKSFLLLLLRVFAKAIIKKYRPDVVGITGSVGKTSAKEAIAQVLRGRFEVRASYKNYNNEIGVPLAIIGAEKTPGSSALGWLGVFGRALGQLLVRKKNYPHILALEMGADKPGDIGYLTNLAPCRVGVITSIAHAHTESFKTIKKIAYEKRQMISHLARESYAVLNFDNELVMENAYVTKAERITYGFKEGADFKASDVTIITDDASGWPTGLNFKVTHRGSTVPIFLPGFVAESFISSALAALAVGYIFGVNLVDAAEQLRVIPPLAGHMRLLSGIKDTLLVDDTYNSSPDPVKSALATIAKINLRPGAERYAVLGDMLELGPETENTHREAGFRVAELGIDFLITVGEASKLTANAAQEAGLAEHRVAKFADSAAAGKFLQDKIKPGDVILIKGSQGMRMERIVKEVMAEPLRAAELLVRQEEEWLRR